MKTEIGSIKKVRSPKTYTDYLVVGLISRLNSCFDGSPTIIRSVSDLTHYLDQNLPEFKEVSEIINSGVTVILRNSFVDLSEYHAFMTPINEDLVIPTCCIDSNKLNILRDPTEFNGETYVINIKYDPRDSSEGFFINLPSGFIEPSLDSEFVSSINAYLGSTPPESADSFNEVLNINVVGDTLGDVFDNLSTYFRKSGDVTFIGPYMAKNSVNDRSKGLFSVFYNQPVKYLPKTISPSNLEITYGFLDNVEFLREYIPNDTVTFESKIVGDSSDLIVKYDGTNLTISFGDDVEEFEVDGDKFSGKFIGDIQSKYVNIIINSSNLDKIDIPSFERAFKSPRDLYESEIDVNESLKNLLDSELEVNMIILSDSLINFDPQNIDTKALDRELILMSINDASKIPKIYEEIDNTVRFSGKIDGIPCYVKFLNSINSCDFDIRLSGIPECTKSSALESAGIWYPEIDEYYNILNIGDTPKVNYELDIDFTKITAYHLVYILAISKFILRYKFKILFNASAVGSLRNLLNEFSSKFSIIDYIEIQSYEQTENKLTVTLSTKLGTILRYKKIIINFNLEI